MTKHWLIGGLLALACAAGAAGPEEDAFLRPVGQPPVAKAQRRQGGESLPPLPLPEKERGIILASTAGTPFRDPSLHGTREELFRRREALVARLRRRGVPKWFRK